MSRVLKKNDDGTLSIDFVTAGAVLAVLAGVWPAMHWLAVPANREKHRRWVRECNARRRARSGVLERERRAARERMQRLRAKRRAT